MLDLGVKAAENYVVQELYRHVGVAFHESRRSSLISDSRMVRADEMHPGWAADIIEIDGVAILKTPPHLN